MALPLTNDALVLPCAGLRSLGLSSSCVTPDEADRLLVLIAKQEGGAVLGDDERTELRRINDRRALKMRSKGEEDPEAFPLLLR